LKSRVVVPFFEITRLALRDAGDSPARIVQAPRKPLREKSEFLS
jgi:hypothetical protein